jgi:hypothetical protein
MKPFHIIPFISVTRTDGNRKDELTIKFFSVPMHKTSQAAQGCSIMAHRAFHKSSLDVRKCNKFTQKAKKFQLFLFHCQSTRSIYYIFFSYKARITQNTFQISLAQESESLFHFFLPSFAVFSPSLSSTIEWEFVSSNNTTEANALNNDLALFFSFLIDL